MLGPQQLHSLAESRSTNEITALLAEGPYGPATSKVQPGSSIVEFEHAISSTFTGILRQLSLAARGDTREFLAKYRVRLDAYDFAALAMFKAAGKTWDEYLATRRPLSEKREQDLHRLYAVEDLASLARELGNRFVVARLKGSSLADLEGEKSAIIRDIIAGWGEEQFYRYVEKMSGGDARNSLPIVGSAVDMTNVLIILRSKLIGATNVKDHLVTARWKLDAGAVDQLIAFQDVPQGLDFMASHYYYGRLFAGARQKFEDSKSLTFLEIALRQHHLRLSRRIFLGFPYTVGIVHAFLVYLENEARNIAAIFTGVDSGLGSDEIRFLLTPLE